MIKLETKLPGEDWTLYGEYEDDKRHIADRRAADFVWHVPDGETRISEGE